MAPRARRQSMRPLPLWERATQRFNGHGWVRGDAVTPHPAEHVEFPAMPSPTRGEGEHGGRRVRGTHAQLSSSTHQLFSPARIFCLNSAICEIVWLVSG